jgi:hypothetical protein
MRNDRSAYTCMNPGTTWHAPLGSTGFRTRMRVLLLTVAGLLSASPAAADIGSANLTSAGSTSAVLTFSHPGFQARDFPFGFAQGNLYRICWRQVSNQPGLACMFNAWNSDVPQWTIGNLTVGMTINITVQCFCGRHRWGNVYGPFGERFVASISYTHQLPPPVPGLVGSTNVRVRGVQSGQCLFINSTNSMVRGWPCWADPAMVFALESFSDGSKRLRHVQSGLCITALDFTWDVMALPCGGNGAKLAIMPQPGSGNPVLARFMFVRRPFGSSQMGSTCLMTNLANGLNATRQICGAGGAALPLILDPV